MTIQTDELEKTILDFEKAKAGMNLERQYLTFQIGPEEYGINILSVKEIIVYSSLTKIPMVPEYILGVMNVRGNVVPVVDLAPRFGMLSAEFTKLTCIVIVEIGEGEDVSDVGIVVDSVEDVLDISEDQIEGAPGFGAKLRADFIAGIGKIGERFVILLNINRVLDLDELSHFDRYKRSVHLERMISKKEHEEREKTAQVEKTVAGVNSGD
jgi:purine-binding chemotaxis protein CheW